MANHVSDFALHMISMKSVSVYMKERQDNLGMILLLILYRNVLDWADQILLFRHLYMEAICPAK